MTPDSKQIFIMQTQDLSKYELIDLAYDYRERAMILGERLKITPTPEGSEDEVDRLMFEVDMAKTDALIYANKLNQANDAITVLQTLTIALNQRIGNAIVTLQDTVAVNDKQGLIYSLILSAIRILEGRA